MSAYRAISVLLLLTMCTAGNLHLPVLQAVAWSRMMASYSRDFSVADAIEMTFDGDHPCPMCKSIKKAQTASAGESHLRGVPEHKTRDLCYLPVLPVTSTAPAGARQPFDAISGHGARSLVFPPPTPPPIGA